MVRDLEERHQQDSHSRVTGKLTFRQVTQSEMMPMQAASTVPHSLPPCPDQAAQGRRKDYAGVSSVGGAGGEADGYRKGG